MLTIEQITPLADGHRVRLGGTIEHDAGFAPVDLIYVLGQAGYRASISDANVLTVFDRETRYQLEVEGAGLVRRVDAPLKLIAAITAHTKEGVPFDGGAFERPTQE